MHDPKLILSQEDFQKLSQLLLSASRDTAQLLEEELGRASVVTPDKVPRDAVTMNSTVKFVDQDSGKETVVTLVYPHEANIQEQKISVLSPIGSALIGLRVGQSINWPMPNGTERNLKVISVTPAVT